MVLRFIKNITNKKYKNIESKQRLEIEQLNEIVKIKGLLGRPNFIVNKLRFVSRSTENIFEFNNHGNSSEFNFEINLRNHLMGEEDIYDLYLVVKTKSDLISKNVLDRLKKKYSDTMRDIDEENIEFPIRLGNFLETDIKYMEHTLYENKYYLRPTIKGNISLYINKEIQPKVSHHINTFESKIDTAILNGRLLTYGSKINDMKLIISGRDNKQEIKLPVNYTFLRDETSKNSGLNLYNYNIDINFSEITKQKTLNDDIYDLFLEIKLHDCEDIVLVRVGKPKYRGWKKTKTIQVNHGSDILAINPYYTIIATNLSFQIDSFKRENYIYLKKLMKWSWLLRPFYRNKNIWIVGERPYKAQDTGYHFFKYMRKNHPEMNVFYVIEENSPELKNVSELGNVLYYKSKEHIKSVLFSTRIIGSHHPDYLYPLRTFEFMKKIKAKKVFIQHGVLGTKNTSNLYGKYSPSFDTDLFLVSSDYEKSIVVKDFEYQPSEVAVTGLSRFDGLFKDDITLKRQLLIIPTWRQWLTNEEKFLESEYFDRYKSLVNNTRLHDLANQHQFDIVFCLHPNMQKYTPYFKDSPVRVISQGEVNVQDLLKESSLMITDYSSVGFDFSFLEKPIIYYQFDRKKFLGPRGSHLDIDNDLPGDIVVDLEDILKLVENYAKEDFRMKDIYLERSNKFIKYKDLNNNKRIYQAITHIPKRSLINSILYSIKLRSFFKRFRRSRYYIPLMRILYNFMKNVLPVDNKLILFESGLGKHYADSPRYIYEEIVDRGLNYKKVWVYNKNMRFKDPNTIKVRRLSPKYFYYLARAKVWVNNQNFPTYIRKRKSTTFVQTWHGTPLKKMLFDIKEVHGRSDDYVERVRNAIKNWDYLISPSPYATRAFKSAFKFEGDILEIGYPRNDLFYKEDSHILANKVKKRLNIPFEKKVILYAPTFRDNQTSKKNKFIFDLKLDLNALKEKLGNEYMILLRMHVLISNKIKVDEQLDDFVINVSDYPEMQELLLISDILITDYSSVMFDYANTKRPIMFFTYDLDEYKEKLRGFYIDFESEAPGPLLSNSEEIISAVLNVNEMEREYNEKYMSFIKKYCLLEDGNATKRAVDILFK